MRHVIIGGGAAAGAAAGMLRQADAGADITVLCGEKRKPYAKMGLPYLLSGDVEEKNLRLRFPPGIDLRIGCAAARIDTGRRRVILADASRVPYDRLLLATGAVPELPEIDGIDSPRVFTVRNLPDIRGILRRLPPDGGKAVLAGAGPVSMETADALAKRGVRVTFVVSSDRLFSTMLDKPAAEVVERHLEERGVVVRKKEDIVSIEAEGARLRSGVTLAADLIVFGKGVRPDLSLLPGTGIEAGRGVLTDRHQRTNVPDVYAAGDVAETLDIAWDERRVNALWPVAVEQGRVAALNMAGIAADYPGGLARNILRVFGLSIYVAGKGRADGPDVRRAEGPGFHRKLVMNGKTLGGAIFIGEIRQEGICTDLIRNRADASPFLSSLMQGSLRYGRKMRRDLKI